MPENLIVENAPEPGFQDYLGLLEGFLTLSCGMVVAPMMVEVTYQREAHQASASCVAVRPLLAASSAYFLVAAEVMGLMYRGWNPVNQSHDDLS